MSGHPTVSPSPRPAAERRWTLALVALALALPLGALLQPWLLPARSDLPLVRQGLHAPVILVTVPGLRADRVHHLGYERETTPVLDRLLSHGVSFTKAYSSSNDGHASLAALHGGLAPAVSGVLGPGDTLAPSVLTLAERVKRHSYHTVAVRADPSQAGLGLRQGFEVLEDLPAGSPADALLDRALELFDAAPGPNVLLWVDLPDLLRPHGHAGLDATRFAPDMPRGFGERATVLERDQLAARGWGERELAWLEARYDAAVFELDAALGRFLDGLNERMVLDTLSLCVAGTRGERLTDRPGTVMADGIDLYEHSVHVPLLFRFPQKAIRGRLLPEFASSVDIGPTLLQLALKSGPRSEWPDGCGRSLVPTITNRQQTNPVAVTQGRHVGTRLRLPGGELPLHQAIRADRYKLIAPIGDSAAGLELYDLAKDPDERRPAASGAPDLTAALLRHGTTWLQDCGAGR